MRAIAIALLLAACGDGRTVDEVFVATGGSRLALQRYRFADGTEQDDPTELYDTALHVRCAPDHWIDGALRCVPIADAAVFRDATCTELVGRADLIEKPTHFLAYEWRGDERLPARVVRAGAATDPITMGFELRDGVCVGPFATDGDAMYFATIDDVADLEPVGLTETETGDGRLGIRVRASDDGAQVPFGFRDRELDVPCTPAVDPDGDTTRCEPTDVTPTSTYLDDTCTEPVVVVAAGDPVPAIATLADARGCSGYFRIGEAVSGPIYTRSGTSCTRVAVTPDARIFALAAQPIELVSLARTVEDTGGRRLQRIVLSDGALRFLDAPLFDTATRASCRRVAVADPETDKPPTIRCLPAELAPAARLATAGCAVAVPAVIQEPDACARLAFAAYAGDAGPEIRAIGDCVTDALFVGVPGSCQPFAPPAGDEVHALGPAIDPTVFLDAIYFGVR